VYSLRWICEVLNFEIYFFPTPLQSPPSPALHTRHLMYPTGSQVFQLDIAEAMASDALNGVSAEDPSTNRPVSINSVT
jgi:hypothetical protein